MKPNILFIVIDSLRADKCYGETKTSQTPNIDKLIRNGVYFEQATSSIASTGAAMSTIFTGLYPFKTGMSGDSYEKIDTSIKTYVKGLKEFGYHTYSTSPELASLLGLTCDFENVDKSYQNYFGLFAGLGKQIVEKLENKSLEEPWFFYIHLVDLHSPIIVPKEFDNEKFGTSEYEKMVSVIDHWIGKFLKKIDLDQTLVILTADHGDYIPIILDDAGKELNFQTSGLEKTVWKVGNKIPKSLYPLKQQASKLLHYGRHKLKETKLDSYNLSVYQKRVLTNSRMDPDHHVYDDVICVPLIFSGYSINSQKRVTQQVRHVDIFPTVSDLINYDHTETVDGVSLLPLIRGQEMEEQFTFIQSMPRLKQEDKQKVGLRTSKFKYLRNVDGDEQSIELYDLEKDPLEENNIATEKPEIVSDMEKTLSNIHNNVTSHSTTTYEERKKIEEELKKLGYV